jgi:hypothetical protein
MHAVNNLKFLLVEVKENTLPRLTQGSAIICICLFAERSVTHFKQELILIYNTNDMHIYIYIHNEKSSQYAINFTSGIPVCGLSSTLSWHGTAENG